MRSSEEKLVDLVRTGRMSRRQIHRLFAGLGIATVATKLAAGNAFAGSDAVMFTWATMDVPELFPSYVKKHGGPPKFAVFGDEDEAFLKVRNGFRPDVVYPMSYNTKEWLEAGLLMPIDTSRLKNWNDIFPIFRQTAGDSIGSQHYWAPVDWGMSSVLVRTDLAPDYASKDTWDILWDEKYKGRLATLDSMADAVGAAALYSGVNAYEMGDIELAKVRAALEAQRPLLRFYSNDPTSIQQALSSGELVASNTWNDCYTALRGAGLPVKYMKPKNGLMAWVGGLSILKGTPNLDLAYDIIDAYLEPQARVFEMKKYGYLSATAGGFKAVDEATLRKFDLPSDPTSILKNTVIQRPMKDQAKVQKMFEEVKQGL